MGQCASNRPLFTAARGPPAHRRGLPAASSHRSSTRAQIGKQEARLKPSGSHTIRCRCWVRTNKKGSPRPTVSRRAFYWPGYVTVRAPSDTASAQYLLKEDSHYVELLNFRKRYRMKQLAH